MQAWKAVIWTVAVLAVAIAFPFAPSAVGAHPLAASASANTPRISCASVARLQSRSAAAQASCETVQQSELDLSQQALTRGKPRSAQEAPMQVHIVRSSAPGCEPHCPEWIAAQGKIEPGTLQKFKTALQQAGNRHLPVFLHSGGGSVSEAMAIGRLLRAKGIDTVVTVTLFSPCAPTDTACRKKKQPDGVLHGLPYPVATCASSCVFVLAGGKRRFVGAVANIGVHQIKTLQTYRKVRRVYQMMRQPDGSLTKKLLSEETLSKKTIETKTGKDAYDRMASFFSELGIGKEMVMLFRSTPNASVRWLTPVELKSTGLSTESKDGLLLNAETIAMKKTPHGSDRSNRQPAAR